MWVSAGSAILNENGGTIVLTGGTIIGNVSTYTDADKAAGGAIYSTGLITVAASKDAAGTASPATILIKDNTRTDGSAGNIVLNGAGAYVQMQSTVQNSEIHITSTAGLAQNQPLVRFSSCIFVWQTAWHGFPLVCRGDGGTSGRTCVFDFPPW